MIDVPRQVTRDTAGIFHGADAGQPGGAEPHEFTCRFGIVADGRTAVLSDADRPDDFMQAGHDPVDVVI